MTDKEVRVRFAPSPTGKLHVGGARTAIYNWAYARAMGGKFILRIEDTDPERSTEENIQIILRGMKWLGLDWDEGPEVGGPYGPYKQTERFDTYNAALEILKKRDACYPCFCSKEELDAKRCAAKEEKGGYDGYDRTCRKLSKDQAQARIDAGEPHVWRLKVPENHGPVTFHDFAFGNMSYPIESLDDMVLVRTDGSPTYNFAVVCDDMNMNITHVIRGDDHLSNTPKQVLIYEALGAQVPEFAHLSMICGPDGSKLSKRHGATNVEEYRDRGYLSDAFVNFLALLGWSLDGETTIIPREQLCKSFDIERLSKKNAIFDETKLDWMNGQYIKDMGPKAWVTSAKPWLIEAGANAETFDENSAYYEKFYPLVNERLTRLDQIPDKLSFMFWGPEVKLDQASIEKAFLKEGQRADEALRAARGIIADESIEWKCDPIQDAIKAKCEPMDIKVKLMFQPVRVAICGNLVSPPLFESAELLKREDVLARIDYCLEKFF